MTTNLELINYFNAISKSYKANETASFNITKQLRNKLISKIDDFENKAVLDIMSGCGENIKAIKNYNSNTTFTTVDYATEMNKIARKNLTSLHVNQIEGDFFKVDFNNKSFDVVLCSFGVKTLNDKMKTCFCKKISKLLNANGEILILELVKPNNFFFNIIIRFYLTEIVPKIFGKKFKNLFPFVKKHKNMKFLKFGLIENNLTILEHKRILDLFEIIHAKKQSNNSII